MPTYGSLILNALLVLAVAALIGVMITVLTGCGDGSAKCRDEVRVDESTEYGEHYRICRAGAHTVIYKIDDNGNAIERPDGSVSYADSE